MPTRRPSRGEVYWVDLDPVVGVEQGGRRPALIVQNNRGNAYSSYTVVVALSRAPLSRVYPFTVRFPSGEANLNHAGHINCAHIRTIDQSRLQSFIGEMSDEIMEQVGDALRYELEV